MRSWLLYFVIFCNFFIGIQETGSHLYASQTSRKIKTGDVIEILIYGHEDLSRVEKVTSEGRINFPFIQNIPVDGLSLEELEDIIVVQLSKFVERKPIVTLNFLSSFLINVTILGQVQKPGAYRISQNATIQGAIGEAAGLLPGAKVKEMQLIRQMNGEQQIIPVDLEKYILEANTNLLPPLEDGDVIFIPGWPGATSVKVTGEVKEPGNYEVFANLQNVLDLIFKAGGATENADLSRVVLFSPQRKDHREHVINIKQSLTTQQYDLIPVVQPGDVIYIPKARNYWRTFVQVMRDVTSFATLYIILRYGRRL